jgi:nucleoside-diphosphate-sugar epimerase
MRVLVTGDSGFIGSKTALALAALGHQVRGIDKKSGISTANAELFELSVKSFKPELIVHMGASCSTRVSIEKPTMDFTDNAVGTFNVAEMARTHGNIPVLYTSTCKVEAGADGLVAPLGLSKKVGEEYLTAYRKLFGLPTVILQPSTIYGPGQKGDRNLGWVSHFIRCAVEGSQPVVYGTGEQTRDILYIDDFIRLVVDIVENFEIYEGHIYPVGGGAENEISLNTLLHHLGMNQYTRQPAMPSDLVQVVQDNTAISSVNGWHPTTHWKTGVQKTRESL